MNRIVVLFISALLFSACANTKKQTIDGTVSNDCEIHYSDSTSSFVKTIIGTDTILGFVFGKNMELNLPETMVLYTPTASDIKQAETIIWENFDKILKANPYGDLLVNREANLSYIRQYVGYFDSKKKKIFIICAYTEQLSDIVYPDYFSRNLYWFNDGGDAIWEVTIDLAKKSLERIYIHGEA